MAGTSGVDAPARQIAIDLATREVDRELTAVDGIENKAATILGFMAILVALLLQRPWTWWSALPLVLAGATGAACLFTMWLGEIFLGPDPRAFYEDYALASLSDVDMALLAGLDQVLKKNREVAEAKGRRLVWSLIGAVLSIISAVAVYFLLRG